MAAPPPLSPRHAVVLLACCLLGLVAVAPAAPCAALSARLIPPGEGGQSVLAERRPWARAAGEIAPPAPSDSGSRARLVSPWTWPIDPPVTIVRYFDPPPLPWLPGHRGVDLAAGGGMAVHAAGPGVVTFADRLVDRGVVVIQHEGVRTTYEPVKALVDVGEGVWAGKVIGQVSPDGGHCADRECLHWGLLRGSAYLDPLLLLGAGRVMLVPP